MQLEKKFFFFGNETPHVNLNEYQMTFPSEIITIQLRLIPIPIRKQKKNFFFQQPLCN